MEEAEQLRAKLEELCQLLHESQERENLAMEQAGTARMRLNISRMSLKLEVEHEYAQTKLELEYCQAVDVNGRRRRRNCWNS